MTLSRHPSGSWGLFGLGMDPSFRWGDAEVPKVIR